MQAERIARLLPEVYQRTIVPGTPIASLIDVMAQLHAPVEDVLAHLPDYFDPQLTPDRFVPFLARWVDLSRWLDESGGFDSGIGRLRQVVAGAAHLSRLRGTAQGLRDALEWATGVSGVRIDEQTTDAAGRPRPFHVVVTLPSGAAVHRLLVERIVEQEKPAHVTADVVFEDGPAVEAPGAAETTAAPTLPVGQPDAQPEPSFPGSEPAPVLTGVPEAVVDAGASPTPSPSPGPSPVPPVASPSPVPPVASPSPVPPVASPSPSSLPGAAPPLPAPPPPAPPLPAEPPA